MPTKNVIVRCAACGATWCSSARSPRCASRSCRSSNVQRLTVAEVEVTIEDLLNCLNEFDENTYYALVKIDDEQYQKLPADFDLSEILTEAIDADEEDEEPEEDEDEDGVEVEDDEEVEEDESSLDRAIRMVDKEWDCLWAIREQLRLLPPDETRSRVALTELEVEFDILSRRLSALKRVRDDYADAPADDNRAEGKS